jgi:hypothetical protein
MATAAFTSFVSRQGTESYGPYPALHWQIPEQITQMTGVDPNPVTQRKSLFGREVLKADILRYEHLGNQIIPKATINNL